MSIKLICVKCKRIMSRRSTKYLIKHREDYVCGKCKPNIFSNEDKEKIIKECLEDENEW